MLTVFPVNDLLSADAASVKYKVIHAAGWQNTNNTNKEWFLDIIILLIGASK